MTATNSLPALGSLALFQPRKARIVRFGRYAGQVVEIWHHKEDGTVLVFGRGGEDRFSAYLDELTFLPKFHGSAKNLTLNNDGTLRTFDNDDSK